MNRCLAKRSLVLHRRFIASIIALVTLVMMASGQAPAPKPLTPEQNEKLKERDRLAKESNDLAPARKPSEAIVAAAKKLAIERDVLGNLHEDTLKSLSHVGVRIVEYLNADDQSDDAGEKLPF